MSRDSNTDISKRTDDAAALGQENAGPAVSKTALTLTDDEVELVITKIATAADSLLHSLPATRPTGGKDDS